MAASHLMRLGLRRFAFFGDGTAFSTRRGGAFRAALASRGIGCLMSDEVLSPQADIGEAVGSPGGRPLGVFCCNDDRADAIAAFCLAMGLRIPDDAGVLGAENVDTVILRCPVPLSSIEIPTFEIGFRAAELLLGMLGGARAPSRPVLVPPLRVVVRRSTDVLAVDDPAVRRALRFIRAKGHTDVNVENVWRASGLSRRALEKRFRDELRSTIHEELAAYRHDRAKELLGSTGLPVSEVASRSGFNSHAWFARAFREREGTSPTEYRARARTPR
jgi:LacI family transcriptional regulator